MTAIPALSFEIAGSHDLEEAVLRAVIYADIFDYPLTREQVMTYMPVPSGSESEVHDAIDALLDEGDRLECDGDLLFLPGRGATVAIRRERAVHARSTWGRARFYARLIWALPFVRMVAVTGALAMDNVDGGDDIDLLIVTEPGRLWLTRGMILLGARAARLFGDTLCPNYLLSTRALRLDDRDIYTAHEMAQMMPLHGRAASAQLWAENAWYQEFLPNVRSPAAIASDDLHPILRAVRRTIRIVFAGPLGDAVERWERRRKIAKLSQRAASDSRETRYTPDVCKGHERGHHTRVKAAWQSRQA